LNPDVFWRQNSIEELSAEQGLSCAPDIEAFMGDGSGNELDDDFENAYVRWRERKE
jgi:hypothetical protein